jgi:hypothetical protein
VGEKSGCTFTAIAGIGPPNIEPSCTSICPAPTRPRDTSDERLGPPRLIPPPLLPGDGPREPNEDCEADLARVEPREEIEAEDTRRPVLVMVLVVLVWWWWWWWVLVVRVR